MSGIAVASDSDKQNIVQLSASTSTDGISGTIVTASVEITTPITETDPSGQQTFEVVETVTVEISGTGT